MVRDARDQVEVPLLRNGIVLEYDVRGRGSEDSRFRGRGEYLFEDKFALGSRTTLSFVE